MESNKNELVSENINIRKKFLCCIERDHNYIKNYLVSAFDGDKITLNSKSGDDLIIDFENNVVYFQYKFELKPGIKALKSRKFKSYAGLLAFINRNKNAAMTSKQMREFHLTRLYSIKAEINRLNIELIALNSVVTNFNNN